MHTTSTATKEGDELHYACQPGYAIDRSNPDLAGSDGTSFVLGCFQCNAGNNGRKPICRKFLGPVLNNLLQELKKKHCIKPCDCTGCPICSRTGLTFIWVFHHLAQLPRQNWADSGTLKIQVNPSQSKNRWDTLYNLMEENDRHKCIECFPTDLRQGREIPLSPELAHVSALLQAGTSSYRMSAYFHYF